MSQAPDRPNVELAVPDSSARLRLSKIGIAASLLLLVALVVFAIAHVGDERRFARLLEHAEPVWLLAAVAAQIGTYVCAGAVWGRVASASGYVLPRAKLARLSIEKLSVNQFMPTGGMAGNVVVMSAMRRMGLPPAVATEALIVDVLSHYAAFGSMAFLALAVLWVHHDVTPVIVALLAVFTILVAAVPLAVMWLLRHRDWTPGPRLARLRVVARLRTALAEVSPRRIWNRRLLAITAALQAGIFLLDGLTLWAVLRSLGATVDPLTTLVAVVMAAIAGALSFLPGGIGSYEAGCTACLSLLGLPLEVALAGTLALRGLTLWLPLVPGLLLARRDLAHRTDSGSTGMIGPKPYSPRLALPELFERLGATAQGLTTANATVRLAATGPNELEPGGPRIGRELVRAIANPLALILLAASLAAALLGETADAVIIATMVLLSGGVNLWQSSRSARAIRGLQARVTPTASVLRDGTWSTIPRRDVVVGDLIRLSAGDLIPADARLVESTDLHVQQAALTGESLPAEKRASAAAIDRDGADAGELVFVGTSVVSGAATAVVIATGARTAFGDIAMQLAKRPEETEFERGSRLFGMLILETVVVVVLLVLVVNLAMGRDGFQSLLFAVALAVGLTPEYLPMITTVTLAQGAVHMARERVIVKHLASIQNLGSMDVLCSDKTGTLTAGTLSLNAALDPLGRDSDRTLLLGHLNSALQTGVHSALDVAILERPVAGEEGFTKLAEIPFDFERRRLSVVVAHADDRILVTKGAPETVLAACTRLEIDGQPRALDDAARHACADRFAQLSTAGYRVLAVAYRRCLADERPGPGQERELILVGFLTFAEQVVEDAGRAIENLRRDGVTVKILSGDNELVVRSVCRRVGIDAERVVSGDEVAAMDVMALAHVAEDVSVFARVSPAQKHLIVRALKARGHVVGFMGDGINDAPSLHAADVGISVAGAVDVAREAADILLLEKTLDVLHAGVVAGRRSFANVFKYLLMGTSSNFGNVLSMAAVVFFLPFLPMLPTQILVNNFIYDAAQVTIPTDSVDPAFVRGPQRWDIRVIRRFMLQIGPVSSIFDFLTFGVLLFVFDFGESLFQTGWFVESLSTQVLVVFVIRTAGRPWKNRPSMALTVSVLAAVVVAVTLPYVPMLAGPLGMTPLPPRYFAFVALVVPSYLVLVELLKKRVLQRLATDPGVTRAEDVSARPVPRARAVPARAARRHRMASR